MSNDAMRDEGAAYLAALNLKKRFNPVAEDLVPDRIEQSIASVTKIQEALQGCLDKIQDTELVKELASMRREIQSYLMVLKSLADNLAKAEGPQGASLRYFLDPKAEMDIPSLAEAKRVRALLLRLAGFNDQALRLIESNMALREQYEKNRLFASTNKLQQKAESSKMAGFFKKIGM